MTKWIKKAFSMVLLIALTVSASKIEVRRKEQSCLKSVQNTFFKRQTVLTGLSLSPVYISQSQWREITEDLIKRNSRIARSMNEEAKRLPLNVLEEKPLDINEMERLLNPIAWRVFQEVMNKYEVTDIHVQRSVYQYIYNAEIARFKRCLYRNTLKNWEFDKEVP